MKKLFSIIAIGLVLLLLSAYIFYFRPYYYLFNGGMIEFDSEIRQELYRGQFMQVISYGSSIYFCSREGLEKRDLQGNSEWTKPFQMVSPSFKRSGDYFVVVDVLGHDAYIFHESGFLSHVRENLPIVSAFINNSGQLTLVLDGALENRIKVYGKDGVALIERGSVLSQDGYPVSLALSDNGLNLVTSYADVLSGGLATKVTMFGFADYQEDLDEFIVRADVYEGELIPRVHFFGSRSLWLVGTKSVRFYLMNGRKEVYDKPQGVELVGETVDVYFTDREAILLSDTKVEGVGRFVVRVFREDGVLMGELTFAERPLLVQPGDDHFFVAIDSKIIKYKGTDLVWSYPFYEPIDAFYEIDRDRYLLVQPMGYTVWKKRDIY